MKYRGYLREDNKIGIRNKVLIVALDECCDGIAKQIANGYEDVVVLTNHYTCMLGGNEETFNQMKEICNNPNIASVLVINMGCGSIMCDYFVESANCKKMIDSLSVIECSGSRNAIKVGKEKLEKLIEYRNNTKVVDADLSSLVVGVKCGGSDTSSGIASNPSVGLAADKLIDNGATVIVGEPIELMGCEEKLRKMCINEEVGDKLTHLIQEEVRRWNVEGTEVESMSIGNSIGGLTTIEEKSFGALKKIGSKTIQDVLLIDKHGVDKPTKPGLYLSESTHLCGSAGVNFAAMSANLILWTTGGAAFDNPIVPVIKVSGNEELINDDIDIDATGIMKGVEGIDPIANRIVDKVIDVCNGEKTSTEDVSFSYLSIYQKDLRIENMFNINCRKNYKQGGLQNA